MARCQNVSLATLILSLVLLLGVVQAYATQDQYTYADRRAQRALGARSIGLAGSFRRLQDTPLAVDDDVDDDVGTTEPSSGGTAVPPQAPATAVPPQAPATAVPPQAPATATTQPTPAQPAPATPAPTEPANPVLAPPPTEPPATTAVEPEADPPGVEPPAPAESPTPDDTSAEPTAPPVNPSPADPINPAVDTPEPSTPTPAPPDTLAPASPVPETPVPEVVPAQGSVPPAQSDVVQPGTAGPAAPTVPPVDPDMLESDSGGGAVAPPPDDDEDDGEDLPDVDGDDNGDDDDDGGNEPEPVTGGAEAPVAATPPAGGAESPVEATPPTGETDPPVAGTPPAGGPDPPVAATPPTGETESPPVVDPTTTGETGPPTENPPTPPGEAPPPSTALPPTTGEAPDGAAPQDTGTGGLDPPVDPEVPVTPEEPTVGGEEVEAEPEEDSEPQSTQAPGGREDSGGLSTPVIAVIAGIAVLAAVVVVFVIARCCCCGGAKKRKSEAASPPLEAHAYYAEPESMQMGSSYGYGGGTSKYYTGPQGPTHPGMHGEHLGYTGGGYGPSGGGYGPSGGGYGPGGGSQPGYPGAAYSSSAFSHTGASQPGYSHAAQPAYSPGTSGMSPQASNAFMARPRPHSRTGSSASGYSNDEHLTMHARPGTPTHTASTIDVGTWRTVITQNRTMLAPDDRDKLERALDNFAQTQTPFLGRFTMLSAAHRRAGGQGVVQFARGVSDGEEYAIKFFTQRSAFDREFELYSNPVLRGMMPAITHIEPNTDSSARSMTGWPMPPCIVIERGESLDMWALRIKPDFTTILQVLTHVATRLQQLHESGLVHRDLKPGNVLWRPQHLAWTLIDFGCAAHTDCEAPLSFSLKYAAPEIVHAYEAKQRTIVADPAMDMWALGLMAYELLTDTAVFPAGTGTKDVCDQITGRQPLPWEEPDQGDSRLSKLRMLRRSLSACLSRDPAERPTSSGLLASWNRLFDSVMGDRTYAPS